ncbi:MAG TPA: hypothetical protein DIT25_00375 [Candidatus Moranbacteria bacterium]|nr:hypothetical protein [Candidatus Moranbacteria bacterium]
MDKIANLSQGPGVYIFKDAKKEIIYIGKATNLRSRVSSYFQGLEGSDPSIGIGSLQYARPIEAFVHEVADLGVQETESVLEALILEANLIKKYQPKYNVKERDDKSFSYFVITKDEFPRVLILRGTEIYSPKRSDRQPSERLMADGPPKRQRESLSGGSIKRIFGPYTSKRQMEIALKIIRRIFPYHAIAAKTEKGCLDFQMGRCPGPYAGAITKKDYTRNIRGITLMLEGNKKNLVRKLEKEMREFAKDQNFEKAEDVKRKIFALNHIQDIALIGAGRDEAVPRLYGAALRIEAYDISNISGDHAVGSMIVFRDDKPDKTQYRKFKIKISNGADDAGMMKEVLTRRFHNTWNKPDLILLDGGKGHLNMAQKVLLDFGLIIPTVAVAKGPTRKKLDLYLGNYKISKEINNILSDQNLLSKIMGEAHRFAIGYHRKLRRKNLLN